MIVSNAVVGVWSLAAYWVRQVRVRPLWWSVIVAEVAIAVQVVLGVALTAGLDLKPLRFHMFYGFVALLTVALLYAYRSQVRPYLYLLYGFGSLFLMGLGIRAIQVR